MEKRGLGYGAFFPNRRSGYRPGHARILAAHETTHSKDRLVDEPAGSSQTIEDSVYWRSEAWADAVARQAVLALGQNGVAAAEAWQTRRMFDLLAGDIQH